MVAMKEPEKPQVYPELHKTGPALINGRALQPASSEMGTPVFHKKV